MTSRIWNLGWACQGQLLNNEQDCNLRFSNGNKAARIFKEGAVVTDSYRIILVEVFTNGQNAKRKEGDGHSILRSLEIITKKSSHYGMQTLGQTYQLSKVCLSTLQLRNKNNESSK